MRVKLRIEARKRLEYKRSVKIFWWSRGRLADSIDGAMYFYPEEVKKEFEEILRLKGWTILSVRAVKVKKDGRPDLRNKMGGMVLFQKGAALGGKDYYFPFHTEGSPFSKAKNTPLARKLAKIYEKHIGPFPGGIHNACIERLRPGHHQRSAGAWSWMLGWINEVDGKSVAEFGSQYSAKEAIEDPLENIQVGFYSTCLGEHVHGVSYFNKVDSMKPPPGGLEHDA